MEEKGKWSIHDPNDLGARGERCEELMQERKIAKEDRPCKSTLSRPGAYGRSKTQWAS
jgi:hypothetical protein